MTLPGHLPDQSAHFHDAGDISGSMPGVRVVGGVHVPNLEARVNVLETTGLRLYVVEYYASSGTFEKADYPGLRAVVVHVQGGGGGSGGCQGTAGTSNASAAGGGGGGGYGRKFIPADDLADTETVTVGAGGAGGGAGNNNGTAGDPSSFGSHVSASGGGGGDGGAATATNIAAGPGAGGTATGADLAIPGDHGGYGMVVGGFPLLTGFGGGSALAGLVRPGDTAQAGKDYGGGAGGGRTSNSVAVAGATGGDGIVIVEVYV